MQKKVEDFKKLLIFFKLLLVQITNPIFFLRNKSSEELEILDSSWVRTRF